MKQYDKCLNEGSVKCHSGGCCGAISKSLVSCNIEIILFEKDECLHFIQGNEEMMLLQ